MKYLGKFLLLVNIMLLGNTLISYSQTKDLEYSISSDDNVYYTVSVQTNVDYKGTINYYLYEGNLVDNKDAVQLETKIETYSPSYTFEKKIDKGEYVIVVANSQDLELVEYFKIE